MSIKIDLRIFLFGILFFLTKQIEIYAILMIFAFLHELAHLLAGLALGYRVKSFGINPFGCQLTFQTPIEDYNTKVKNGNEYCIKKIVIALAGPIFNFLICLICLWVQNDDVILKEQIIYGNFLLGIFNLLPIYPLDGGRVLKQIICLRQGRRRAYQVLSIVSKATVIGLTIITSISILYIHNIAFLIVLGYLWYLVIYNEKRYQLKENIYSKLAFFRKP